MKKLLFALLAMTLFACSSDDSTPVQNPDENENPQNPNPVQCNNVYTGDVLLSTQEEVDDFAAMGYCVINGSLHIGLRVEQVGEGEDWSHDVIESTITSLAGLNKITKIRGGLTIKDNPLLVSLEGLNNLKETGATVEISQNSLLTSLNGLNSLNAIAPQSIDSTLGWLNIKYNPSLLTLEGLASLKEVNTLFITSNINLLNLKGLEGLESVRWMAGIEDNEKLTSLEGLESLKSVESLLIGYNPNLVNYCPIRGLVAYGDGKVKLYANNPVFVPSLQNIIDGNCSQ